MWDKNQNLKQGDRAEKLPSYDHKDFWRFGQKNFLEA